jgi:hypothetical protein
MESGFLFWLFLVGDAKLLFAMSAFFLGSSFIGSLLNLGVFVLFLMVSGSVYGFCFSGVLWWKNRKKVNAEIKRVAFSNKWLVFILIVSLVFILFNRVNFLFLVVGVCLGVFPFLYVFAKGLENVSMVKEISGKDLREGDWLVEDVKVGRKLVKASWDGLSLDDLKILKVKKKVLIKEGLPFVPAFLIAFLGYAIVRDWFLGLFLF